MIKTNRIMVHGVSEGKSASVMSDDGPRTVGGMLTVKRDGTPAEIMDTLTLMENPYAIVYQVVKLAPWNEYRISGTVYPVGSTVYMYPFNEDTEITPELLASTDIAYSADSDGTGAFAFYNQPYSVPQVVVWAYISPEYARAADLRVAAEVISQGTGSVLYVTVTADDPITGDSKTYPAFDISGGCPADATDVYLSYVPDGPVTDDALTENIKHRTGAENGRYLMMSEDAKGGAQKWGRYVVWCVTNAQSGLTVDSFYCSYLTCLSGDTLITLADGSKKRLDQLSEADTVMAGDGTPTPITRLMRGYFNSCHTLYRFDNGAVIDETHEHRFYNLEQGFWQKLKNWKIGEHARGQDGALAALISVERREEPAEMFGIWTESGDYYAGGLLSGDASANRPLLAEATAEQAVDMMTSLGERELEELIGGLRE